VSKLLEKTSLASLDRTFKKFFSQDCFVTLYRVLITELRDSPTQESEVPLGTEGMKFPQGLKKVEKFLLLTSVWYFPENPMSFYIRLECEKLFGKELENEYRVLCSSKLLALGFWLSQDEWNDWDFYGNILRLRQGGKVYSLIHLRLQSTRRVKRYTGYCRGYPESGRWTPYRSKAVLKEKLLTELQWEQRQFLRHLKLLLILKRIRERLELENW